MQDPVLTRSVLWSCAAVVICSLAARPAHADDDWSDSSLDATCDISAGIVDGSRTLGVHFVWFRGSGEPPAFVIVPLGEAFHRGGTVVVESASLDGAWNIAATGGRAVGHGPRVDALRAGIAQDQPWSLTLQPKGKPAQRFVPDVGNAARLIAMFDACRSIDARAPAPAPVAGRLRARDMANQSSHDACVLTASYDVQGHRMALELARRDGSLRLRALADFADDARPTLDLAGLGGTARAVETKDLDIELGAQTAAALTAELAAGSERRIPLRTADGTSRELVFGGPEFAIEGAMFKACLAVN